ncbi:unnamed protein product, partial [Ectocarpus sp. 8 AP-2014]
TSDPRSVAAVTASGAATNGSTVDSATAAAAVTSGGDGESSRAAATSGKKRRLRPVENPYRVAQPQRRQERHRHREGGAQTPPLERDRLGDRLVNETAAAAAAAATPSGPAASVSRADADGGASEHDEWYG